jgi:tetratricopeptide (TPR) repeat protein
MSLKTLPIAILVASIALAGCAGEKQEDTALTAKLTEADSVFKSREYERAGDLFEEIAAEAEDAGNNSLFVEAASMRARSFLVTGKPDEGRPWLERAAAKAVESDPAGWSRYLGVRGRFEWKGGDNETATDTFREMFEYCESNELWERAVDAAHMIAITGDQSERFDWSLKGIEMAERGGMDGWLGPLWNNLGWNYYDEEMYGEAYDALVKAREYHYRGENELPKLIADYSVAHVMMKQERVHEAESEMLKVLEWATRLNMEGDENAVEWMGFARWDLGEMAISVGNTGTGAGMLRQALSEIEKSGMPDWDPDQWKQKQERVAELGG